jgi:hypothetical protein
MKGTWLRHFRASEQHLTIVSIFSYSVSHTFFDRFVAKAQCTAPYLSNYHLIIARRLHTVYSRPAICYKIALLL